MEAHEQTLENSLDIAADMSGAMRGSIEIKRRGV